MLDNFNEEKEIYHHCLMINEQINGPNDLSEQKGGVEEEYEVLNVVHDGLGKCPKRKTIKLLLYFVKQLQRHSFKTKS